MNWFEQTRQDWIAEMLWVYGFINREHLVRKFRISVPQASLDLQKFQAERPGAMHYDLTQKCYCVGPEDPARMGASGNSARRRS